MMACLLIWLRTAAFCTLSVASLAGYAKPYTLTSPDGRVSAVVSSDEQGLAYSLAYDGEPVLAKSALGLIINNQSLGNGPMAVVDETRAGADEWFVQIGGRHSELRDHYQSLELLFSSRQQPERRLAVQLRAYNEGLALRYWLPAQPGLENYTIQNELTRFAFPANYHCFGLNLGKFVNSHEGEFDPIEARHIREHHLLDNPLVCKTGRGQTTFALAEANVRNYPGSWLSGRGDGGLGVETRLTPRFDSDPMGVEKVAVRGSLAREGLHTPWRVVMLGDHPGKLTESSLITVLGEPNQVEDTHWIKPGKVAWDWWNDNQVAFADKTQKPGMNTATYKAYIDFAATLGFEYILIDAGWHEGAAWTSKPGANLLQPIAAMDMPAILQYATSKGVGVWVWVQWKQLDWQMEEALAAYQRWGIKGIKVDFMDRSDQEMVDYYHKLLSTTAKYQIMVNLHGAYPPNGLVRTYPHYLTQEGVMGAEYNKWSERITATHNVTLPFTRMILGPIDYTPGGFRHTTPEQFPALRRNTLPYVKTTRGQALAMFVVYDSPLQMIADSPISYSKGDGIWPQPEYQWEAGLSFIRDVPVTWDETRILQGDIGEYIVSARRKGDVWYLGAMTNEQGRRLKIPLSFLGKGRYHADIWQDGSDASSVQQLEGRYQARHSLSLALAGSGGAVVVLRPMQ